MKLIVYDNASTQKVLKVKVVSDFQYENGLFVKYQIFKSEKIFNNTCIQPWIIAETNFLWLRKVKNHIMNIPKKVLVKHPSWPLTYRVLHFFILNPFNFAPDYVYEIFKSWLVLTFCVIALEWKIIIGIIHWV